MNLIVFPSPLLTQLREDLLSSSEEQAAVLLAQRIGDGSSTDRLLVREIRRLSPDEYLVQDSVRATFSPRVVAEMAQRARSEKACLVFVHSHVGGIAAQFSGVDDAGELELDAFLRRRNIEGPHAALVVAKNGSQARLLASRTSLTVLQVGATVEQATPAEQASEPAEVHDRQVRAFGADGQRRLSHLRIGVVGLGGTGSVVVQQLAHLGVGSFVLVDCDRVEETNLNRLVGATRQDIGIPKVEVACRSVLGAAPGVHIEAVYGNVMDASIAAQLSAVDGVFCCTDSHGSRAVLNQLAYQYLVPTFDIGIVLVARHGAVERIAGRAQMLAPGLGCLVCSETLDSKQVRLDFMSEQDRAQDPYFDGVGAPQPAVISLNSVVASLAVTMFLSAYVGIPAEARLQIYDALRGVVRSAEAPRVPACIVCSDSGALARGREWPLPTRGS